jgi:hypothetical protein
MLVGQVRYPWLERVGSSGKFGWLSDEQLYLKIKAPDGYMQLRLDLP